MNSELNSTIALVFLALAILLPIFLVRARAGPVVMIASGNGRNILADRQALQLQL